MVLPVLVAEAFSSLHSSTLARFPLHLTPIHGSPPAPGPGLHSILWDPVDTDVADWTPGDALGRASRFSRADVDWLRFLCNCDWSSSSTSMRA